ncbi:hypothetical protein ACIO93_35695 [Streptomyces sp. NPDC087903]|uniref:hypothetical protein n=1 Tax=Streptomyces sp. NPDC087903 TaxID=3365819 RepID=UPI0038091DB6
MILGTQFSGGYGAAPGAWRLPGANLNSCTDMDRFVRYAQDAERGKVAPHLARPAAHSPVRLAHATAA